MRCSSAARISRGPLADVLSDIAALLPAGFFHPDSAVASIEWAGQVHATGRMAGTVSRISAGICPRGVCDGTVTVAYRDAWPPQDEGPFLHEERRLDRGCRGPPRRQ